MRAIASLRALRFYEQSVGYFASKDLHMEIHELKLAYSYKRVKAHKFDGRSIVRRWRVWLDALGLRELRHFFGRGAHEGGGLVHCRACDRSARGRGGRDRRPLRICWRMGESGKAVLSICSVPFGAGARGQGAERVVSRGRAKRGGSVRLVWPGRGSLVRQTDQPALRARSPRARRATFPCSVSQKPVSFAPLRGNAAEAGLELEIFDPGV